jgi:hypothetical protein
MPNDLIKPKRVYLINAVPEPFADEDWFREAKQHISYDPARLPPMQITQVGGASIEDVTMRKGKIHEPNTPISVCMNFVTGKMIGRPNHGWVCLSEDTVYFHATYKDVGLVHKSGKKRQDSMISRSFSTRTRSPLENPIYRKGRGFIREVVKDVRRRRYYLIPVPNRQTGYIGFENLADILAAEMIRHAFG